MAVDKIMIAVIDGRQPPGVTDTEKRQIIETIAAAVFSDEEQTLRYWARVAAGKFVNRAHPSRQGELLQEDTVLTSAEWHVLKHTLDQGWPEGTTPAEYIGDIVAAVNHAGALLDLGRAMVRYPDRTERMAPRAATQTDVRAITNVKATQEPGTCVFVVYDPGRSKILSAYRLPRSEAEEALAKWKPRRKL